MMYSIVCSYFIQILGHVVILKYKLQNLFKNRYRSKPKPICKILPTSIQWVENSEWKQEKICCSFNCIKVIESAW